MRNRIFGTNIGLVAMRVLNFYGQRKLANSKFLLLFKIENLT